MTDVRDDVLVVDGLTVGYGGAAPVVSDVSFRVASGEIVGVIGESGCGKSTIATAIMGLLPGSAALDATTLSVGDETLVGRSEKEYASLRGRVMSMVFQEPMSALNPTIRIGPQIAETLIVHRLMDKKAAMVRARELLELVQVPEPDLRMRQFPHQLSGGMRQRVVIAMAMAAKPRLLVADEPTTALDVTVQAQILDLIDEMRTVTGTGVVLISHDLGVIAQTCDRVLVMYAGQIVEEGTPAEVLAAPAHPYTRALLKSIPATDRPGRVELPAIPGGIADEDRARAGCRFQPRCAFATDACAAPQALRPIDPGRAVRCVRSEEVIALEIQEAAA
ncbi:ABC transporter ATP-binding protein [Homoserinibacter sp. YIM 151385]|uniref:ABC transporter ATP-binding protein n=1 Tax=Homoserinibacter sp. YIM 151385 TaxID=2985506 RepID=UPI0022F0B62A|nr:ABC transporter ATP-binding protein [Homoserinibacter sp. YIM 151385]WBU36719.1 ABC transporter ATP-binding protein [Homoserinibacter sp. YIM 151385]